MCSKQTASASAAKPVKASPRLAPAFGNVRQAIVAACPAILLSLASPVLAVDAAPVDRFLSTLDSFSALPADARTLIRQQWSTCEGCDPNEFLTQALAVLSPEFREGLDAYDADEYERCAERMARLASDANPFLAVHAAVYEIKALVEMERLVEAQARILKLTADPARLSAHSYFTAEIEFLRAFCLLADLQYDAAEEALARFLADFPDAPQRLALSARQMLIELSNREPGRMGEVTDLMDYSGRRLKSADGGEIVQSRQQRIIELLDQLIKEAEEQEKNQCSSGGASSSGGRSGARSPSNPMQQSRLPGGNAQQESLRSSRRANPGDVWGNMPPGERERILQALRESFPPRYRQLVEQYYEELAKKP